MKYPELCERLRRELGKAEVFFAAHPDLGVERSTDAKWTILAHDGCFDVGGLDREGLLNEQGEANVLCSSYPGMGATDTSHAKWFILVQDGAFDVGGMDRGERISTRKFPTEEGTCDYVYALMTRKPELHTPTPAELERSRLATEKMMRQLRGDRGPTA